METIQKIRIEIPPNSVYPMQQKVYHNLVYFTSKNKWVYWSGKWVPICNDPNYEVVKYN